MTEPLLQYVHEPNRYVEFRAAVDLKIDSCTACTASYHFLRRYPQILIVIFWGGHATFQAISCRALMPDVGVELNADNVAEVRSIA